ncbi:MAG: hypothetical protein A3E83_03745 [Gammaproteobacteria bacterium RIFCSPHIGHO2_12_FULL_41_20]|nr:MAG: hypothetical protein A3E83_03745 [Gammaproteobacteria bacterium RIFCSPHIGHO2_12_FULL_41_20]
MKKLCMLASAILLIGGTQVGVAADANSGQFKIAVVNVQQVLQQSPKVADQSKKLEVDFKDRQQKINDQQKSLQDELDKFKKESPTMSQKDRDAMQKKITNDRADLVKKVVAYQQDLNKEQGKIMQSILGSLNSIVSEIAKKDKFNLVLDSQAVIYAADGTDITKAVATQFNK